VRVERPVEYYTIEVNGKQNRDAAWYYPDPNLVASNVADRIAFWRDVKVVADSPGDTGGIRFARCDVDTSPHTASVLNSLSIPTNVSFDPAGNEVERLVGVPPRRAITRRSGMPISACPHRRTTRRAIRTRAAGTPGRYNESTSRSDSLRFVVG
jgi:hypothetical protein